MLIILPPSESKRPPLEHGRPVAPDGLSFPALTAMRERILEALTTTTASHDASKRLFVGPTLADEVQRNIGLLEQPARPVLEVYTGPLHQGFDAATLSPAGVARASRDLIVVSALWDVLRPVDRIPSYRLNVCSRLIGMDRLEPAWRTVLPDVLAIAAESHGVVVDLRSSSLQAIGMPSGRRDRVVTVSVRQGGGNGRIGDVVAKRVRGQVARHLLESGVGADSPEQIARVVDARWPVQLDPPLRPDRPWVMTVSAASSRVIPDAT